MYVYVHVYAFWLFDVVLNIWLHTYIRSKHIIHSQQMNVFMSQLILSDSAPYCFDFVEYGLLAIFAFDLRLLFQRYRFSLFLLFQEL